jgi:hypothetical protein
LPPSDRYFGAIVFFSRSAVHPDLKSAVCHIHPMITNRIRDRHFLAKIFGGNLWCLIGWIKSDIVLPWEWFPTLSVCVRNESINTAVFSNSDSIVDSETLTITRSFSAPLKRRPL